MSGIGIITNPHSKLNKRNPGRTALLGYILGSQGHMEVTNSLEDLSRVAREFRSKGISILAINGGDGTICRTLTAFIKEYQGDKLPRVALLKGGTINVLAGNLGIRGTPEQLLFRLLEAHSSAADLTIRTIPSIVVEDSCGFLFGNGVAATFLKEYYKHKSGPLGAMLWVLAVYFSRWFGRQLYDSVVQNSRQTLAPAGAPPVTHNTIAVFCSTLEKMPLGYKLFEKIPTNPGKFQCVSFTIPADDAVYKLPAALIRRNNYESGAKMTVCSDRMTIECDQPFEYTLDGELYVSASNILEIARGPEIEFVKI